MDDFFHTLDERADTRRGEYQQAPTKRTSVGISLKMCPKDAPQWAVKEQASPPPQPSFATPVQNTPCHYRSSTSSSSSSSRRLTSSSGSAGSGVASSSRRGASETPNVSTPAIRHNQQTRGGARTRGGIRSRILTAAAIADAVAH